MACFPCVWLQEFGLVSAQQAQHGLHQGKATVLLSRLSTCLTLSHLRQPLMKRYLHLQCLLQPTHPVCPAWPGLPVCWRLSTASCPHPLKHVCLLAQWIVCLCLVARGAPQGRPWKQTSCLQTCGLFRLPRKRGLASFHAAGRPPALGPYVGACPCASCVAVLPALECALDRQAPCAGLTIP